MPGTTTPATTATAAVVAALALLAGCGQATGQTAAGATSSTSASAVPSATEPSPTSSTPAPESSSGSPSASGSGDVPSAGARRPSSGPLSGSQSGPRSTPTTVEALGTGTPVTAQLFGMHDHDPIGASWPNARIGSMRLWDSGVTWRQVEPRPGVFRFGRLDRSVATARAHGADVLIVLGMTPTFHALRPRSASFYGAGASSPPELGPWQRYVRKVVARYGSRGVSYQVWNEANVAGFWSGSQAEMARVTKAAYDVVRSVSPGARFVAPAFVTRTTTQRRLLGRFYAQSVGGRSMGSLVDVVSLQLYPTRGGTPENSMQILAADRDVLAAHGVGKPVWTTEINYGLTGGRTSWTSLARQRANVARTYLLNAANGVGRVYWYGWDLQSGVANTRLSAGGGLTSGGVAFGVVEAWMIGTRLHGCERRAGTYVCTLSTRNVVRRVYWNPSHVASVALPSGARVAHRLDGGSSRISGGTLRVGYSPVMVETRR